MLNGWYAFIFGVSILRLVNMGEPSLARANLAEQVQVVGALILSIFTFLFFLRVNNEIIEQTRWRGTQRKSEKDVSTKEL